MRLNFLCPTQKINSGFGSKEADTIVRGHEATARLGGRGEAGHPRVMTAQAGAGVSPRP